jgi:hypothetical protein
MACKSLPATGVLDSGIATAAWASVASRGRSRDGSIAMILLSARIEAVAMSEPASAADEVKPRAIATASSSSRSSGGRRLPDPSW